MKNLIEAIKEVGKKITLIQTTLFKLPHKSIHLLPECIYKADSSILTIEDCFYAFHDFIERSETHNNLYLNAYGILQMLFVQSDAVHSLNNSIGRKYSHTVALKKIRELRLLSIGHPTNAYSQNRMCTSIISRATMENESFEFLIYFENGDMEHVTCNLIDLIETQVREINKLSTDLLNFIVEETKQRLNHLNKDYFRSKFDELKIINQIKLFIAGNKSPASSLEEVVNNLNSFRGILKDNHFLSESLDYSINTLCSLLSSCTNNKNDESTIVAIEHELKCIGEMLVEIEEEIEIIIPD
ncbi:TPA: hypothetical protein JBI63_08595 [Legionella pneumophila]|nr:hypothetical protein [Legionella pneumophila subsp. pneumophila]HAU1452088.1 hypothetical protein [Legionella pneumophila]HAU1471083.1 hypothetical protein [Legionella pneumophila]